MICCIKGRWVIYTYGTWWQNGNNTIGISEGKLYSIECAGGYSARLLGGSTVDSSDICLQAAQGSSWVMLLTEAEHSLVPCDTHTLPSAILIT